MRAAEAVLRMLEEIGSLDRIPAAVARAKDKKDPFRLMGFGHRCGLHHTRSNVIVGPTEIPQCVSCAACEQLAVRLADSGAQMQG